MPLPICEVNPKNQPLPFDLVVEDYDDYTSDELARFETDVAAHGQRVPGSMWRGHIIDGRHRYLTCAKLNIGFRYVDVTEQFADEASMRGYVASLNEHRRSRTAPITAEEKRARAATELQRDPLRSDGAIAEAIGPEVSRVTVHRVRKELEEKGVVPGTTPAERRSRSGQVGQGAHTAQPDKQSDRGEPADTSAEGDKPTKPTTRAKPAKDGADRTPEPSRLPSLLDYYNQSPKSEQEAFLGRVLPLLSVNDLLRHLSDQQREALRDLAFGAHAGETGRRLEKILRSDPKAKALLKERAIPPTALKVAFADLSRV
jgi:hypothetical protein